MKKFALLFLLIFSAISCQTERKTVKLEKIIFHAYGCNGYCSAFHLEMDSTKNMKLFAKMVFPQKLPLVCNEDTATTGYFKGSANDILYVKLENIIQTIGVDNLCINSVSCCDCQTIIIIIYYNGKRKYIRTESEFPVVDTLISTLKEICIKSKLIRTKDKFDIEN